MNKGIEILLARMDSHPEEFVTPFPVTPSLSKRRWEELFEAYEDHLTPEERKAYKDKLSGMHSEQFTQRVMQRLFEDTDEYKEAQEKARLEMMRQQELAALQHQALLGNGHNLRSQLSSTLGAAMQNTVLSSARAAINNANAASATLSQSYDHAANQHISRSPEGSVRIRCTEMEVGKQTLTEKTVKKLRELVK